MSEIRPRNTTSLVVGLHTGPIFDRLRSEADFCIGPQTENRLKKLIRIWRALHEYVNFVHDPEKQYRSLSEWSATGVTHQDILCEVERGSPPNAKVNVSYTY